MKSLSRHNSKLKLSELVLKREYFEGDAREIKYGRKKNINAKKELEIIKNTKTHGYGLKNFI